MQKYKALTTFLHDQLGKVEMGQEVEMSDRQAQTPMMFGWVDPVAKTPVQPVQSQEKPAAAPVRRGRRAQNAE